MPLEDETRNILNDALLVRGTQSRIAEALGVTPSTVMRWRDGGEIPPAMIKLLRLYLRGEIPFEMVHPKQDLSSVLKFTPDEWRVIETLALREGIEPGEWIRDQVREYLRFLETRAAPSKVAYPPLRQVTRVAEEAAPAVHWIDLRGGVAAGSQIAAHVIEEPIRTGKAYPEDHYALRVFGQSMEPRIPDGATVIVQAWPSDRKPKKGAIVVYSDASGSTLKVFGYRKAKAGEESDDMGNVPVLRSINPAFPDAQTMDSGKIDAVFVEVL